MERTVYKYHLDIKSSQRVEIPKGSQILSIQLQDGLPCMWVLVSPENDKENRIIEIYGTGHPVKYVAGSDIYHRGTFQVEDGSLVFHVFERI